MQILPSNEKRSLVLFQRTLSVMRIRMTDFLFSLFPTEMYGRFPYAGVMNNSPFWIPLFSRKEGIFSFLRGVRF